MEKHTKILLMTVPLLLLSFGTVYASHDYVVLSDDVTIVVENGEFQEAFIKSFEVNKEDVVRYRDYENGNTRVFAETTSGDYVYLLYGGDKVHVILFADEKQRFTQDSRTVSLF